MYEPFKSAQSVRLLGNAPTTKGANYVYELTFPFQQEHFTLDSIHLSLDTQVIPVGSQASQVNNYGRPKNRSDVKLKKA